MDAISIYGPNGISAFKLLVFLIKEGKTIIRPKIEEKNKIKGISFIP